MNHNRFTIIRTESDQGGFAWFDRLDAPQEAGSLHLQPLGKQGGISTKPAIRAAKGCAFEEADRSSSNGMAIKIHHSTKQHAALAVLLEGMGPGASTSPKKQSNPTQQGKNRPERIPRHKPQPSGSST
jgi:hypothetical protein